MLSAHSVSLLYLRYKRKWVSAFWVIKKTYAYVMHIHIYQTYCQGSIINLIWNDSSPGWADPKKMQHWLFVQTTAINVCQSQKQSAVSSQHGGGGLLMFFKITTIFQLLSPSEIIFIIFFTNFICNPNNLSSFSVSIILLYPLKWREVNGTLKCNIERTP